MNISDLINSIGIIILATGAFIAARGYFSEKDTNIIERTGLSFGNPEHFESMIFQKYSAIFGLFLIMVGSAIQLIPVIFNISGYLRSSYILNIPAYLIFSIFIFLLAHFICRAIVNRKIDLVYLHASLKMIENHIKKDEAAKKNNEGTYKYACKRLIIITDKRFRITKKYDLERKIEFIKLKYIKKFDKIDNSRWVDPYDIR